MCRESYLKIFIRANEPTLFFLPFPCAPLRLSFLLPRNKFVRATRNIERYSHGVSCGRGQRRRRRRVVCTLSTHSATLTEKAHAVDFPFSRIKISIPIQRIYLFGVPCMHIERVCTQIVQCTVRWLLMFNGEFYSWSLGIAISLLFVPRSDTFCSVLFLLFSASFIPFDILCSIRVRRGECRECAAIIIIIDVEILAKIS